MIDLKKVREAQHMTQDELAKHCGVVRQTISNIEVGMTKPSVELAKKIGSALGVDWVLFFDD